jgi:glycosyltransferase involved in cell wall biosynthesis
MNRVYIVDIEAVDTRYTKQWKEHLPIQMREAGLDVVKISGGDVPMATTPGAFLNFAGTNNYKAQQMIEISREFAFGNIKDGDYFLYTDAWNPTVIQLKYMAELLGVKIRIGGLWHAGSYDPHDFLGRLIGNKPWVRNAERSMYDCYDDNFFATQFHLDIFLQTLFDFPFEDAVDPKCHIVGWPMEYLPKVMQPYDTVQKKNKIIFPHRIAPEKQVEIFKDLAASMPEYEWFIAQEHNLSKDEYHKHMAESKVMFSANLQETLGISAYEAALVGTYPMVPDRLSYTEMWEEKYPNRWVTSWKAYQDNKGYLMQFIRNTMERNDLYEKSKEMANQTGDKFFNGKELYSTIKKSMAI